MTTIENMNAERSNYNPLVNTPNKYLFTNNLFSIIWDYITIEFKYLEKINSYGLFLSLLNLINPLEMVLFGKNPLIMEVENCGNRRKIINKVISKDLFIQKII